MTTPTPTRWTSTRAACVFAGAPHRTADELNTCVIKLAIDEGWALDPVEDAELIKLVDSVEGWLDDRDGSSWLCDAASDARDWLNEHIAPEGYWFMFDDGFDLIEAGDSE